MPRGDHNRGVLPSILQPFLLTVQRAEGGPCALCSGDHLLDRCCTHALPCKQLGDACQRLCEDLKEAQKQSFLDCAAGGPGDVVDLSEREWNYCFFFLGGDFVYRTLKPRGF